MRTFTAVLLMVCLRSASALAQGILPGRVEAPEGMEGSLIWLSKTVTIDVLPRTAHVEVATEGCYDLRVNRYSVSRDVLTPYRTDAERGLTAIARHDITPYLRPGRNTLCLLLAPSAGGTQRASAAVCIYGTSAYGQPFSVFSDGSWLVRAAGVRGDSIDGTAQTDCWDGPADDMAMWQPAATADGETHHGFACASPLSCRVVAVHSPMWQNATADSLICGLDDTYRGLLRITLRGAKRGERIRVNGFTYTCKGEMDEQMLTRFTETVTDRITITGSPYFSPSWVTGVELLETGAGWAGWK